MRAKPSGRPRRRELHTQAWYLTILVIVGCLAYENSLSAPFVFDDHGSIVDNPFIRQLVPLSSAVSGPVQSAVAGRPLISLSLAVNYAITGLSAPGFRAGNLLIHLLTGLLLFALISRTINTSPLASRFDGDGEGIALAAAALWLVHPLNTEVIDYVTQRTESIMGFCYLLTLYAAARVIAAPDQSTRWAVIAIAACALGMASKESMVTAPVTVLLFDVMVWTGSVRQTWRDRRLFYLGLAATWLILAVLTIAGPRSHSAGFSSGVSPLLYLSNQPAMLVQYVKLAFWPAQLVLDYGVPHSIPWSSALLFAVLPVALMIATAANLRRDPPLAFLGLWFFVTLAPTSSLLPIATEVGAERRMYLPLMALTLAAVIGVWTGLAALLSSVDVRRRTWLAVASLVAVCSVLVALTRQRNAEYQSSTGIWQTVVDRYPHGRAHYNLGLEWREQGNRAEARRHYEMALADEPAAHYAVGFELDADGRHAEAIAHYREYIRLRPDDVNVVRSYILLGRDLRLEGQFAASIEAYRDAIRRHQSNPDAWAGLGESLLAQQQYDQAELAYREYIKFRPSDAQAHNGLAIALVSRGSEESALPEFARAVELDPTNPAARRNFGNVLASVGRLEEAESQFRQALQLAPREVALHNALGQVLAARGRVPEALTEFRTSLALDPGNQQTFSDFASAFPGVDSVRTLGRLSSLP